MTPEQTALMVELLPTIESMRELADVLGVSRGSINRAAAPFLAIMKLNGTHPKCQCGQDRFHRFGCAYTYDLSRASRGDRIPGRTAIQSAVLLMRRQEIIDALVRGDRFCDIDRRLDLNKEARRNLRFLTPAQRAERERNLRNRYVIVGNRRVIEQDRMAA